MADNMVPVRAPSTVYGTMAGFSGVSMHTILVEKAAFLAARSLPNSTAATTTPHSGLRKAAWITDSAFYKGRERCVEGRRHSRRP
jgi:hypothetical protein